MGRVTERIKSLVLVVLIATSLILTWQLWTYQPNLEELDEASSTTESIGDTIQIEDVVRPSNLIYSVGDEKRMTYGNADDLTEEVVDDLYNLDLWNFVLVDEVYDQEDVYPGQDYIELIYPAGIPAELLQSFVGREEELDLVDLSTEFDRILLFASGDEVVARFVSFQPQLYLEAYVDLNMNVFINDYLLSNHHEDTFSVYSEMVAPHGSRLEKPIYLPVEQVDFMRRSYEIDGSNYISASAFEELLFEDETIQVDRENYIASSEQMSVTNNLFMEYINATSPASVRENPEHVTLQAFNYVNSHGGFTDKYQLYRFTTNNPSLDEAVRFHLVENGVPVLGSGNHGVIEVTRSHQQVISNYTRPLYTLGTDVEFSASETLPEGEVVWDAVTEDYDVDEIVDVRIGYDMSHEQEVTELITFTPAWYVQTTTGAWHRVELFQSEGDYNGLE
ncbi:YycH family regulatory protein [Geomicrobium sp. JCM 19055]|uniref:YycH family regulatory protein n=1 Tax=Geomicrobium sp. JCM 19055 TaxID=1460649 RepID=UPI0009DDCDB4|nr:two-component system activity regulator YycH [Geomicrobium sp. JCM 19055]